MAEELKTFPADVGRICVPQNVYAMIMVAHRGRGSGMASRADLHCWFRRPCRQIPRDGNFNPLCKPSLGLSQLRDLGLLSWKLPGGKGQAGVVAVAEGAAAAGGAAFVKQFGLLRSHTLVVQKVNFGVDWVTGAVEDDAGAGDVGASTFRTGEDVLQLSWVVSRSVSSLEELLLELVCDWKLRGMITATSKSQQ